MGVAELWATVEQAITAYTGLSTATFFTVVAVLVAFYYVVSGFFEPAPTQQRMRGAEIEPAEPLPPPVQLGEITEEELSAYDGTDLKKPLLMAIKGQIYDVTQSRMFYGPGGPYALFAGKDASRALAKMSFEQKDLTGDISGLGPFEIDALQDWEYKFMSKYVKVGTIEKKTAPETDDSASGVTSTTTEGANPIAKGSSTADVPDEPTHTTESNHGTKNIEKKTAPETDDSASGVTSTTTKGANPIAKGRSTADVPDEPTHAAESNHGTKTLDHGADEEQSYTEPKEIDGAEDKKE